MLVDRGNCDFTLKVENVQKAGGKLAIVMNYINNTEKVIMADDGYGGIIEIPAIFISLEDGLDLDFLINEVRKDPLINILKSLDPKKI